jgi:hypothetical protein
MFFSSKGRGTQEKCIKILMGVVKQGCTVRTGQIGQVLGCFEHDNQHSNY